MGRPRLAKHPKPAELEPEEISQEEPEEEGVAEEEGATPTVSKAEAIRRTLAEGITSGPQAVAHIKKQFGLDVTTGHFAASKSREGDKASSGAALKRGRAAGRVAEPEVERPSPTAEATTMTKADVCRAALAEGIETTEEAVDYARRVHGMEIKPSDFTVYKSKSKKQGEPSFPAKRGRKPETSQLVRVEEAIQPSVGKSVIGDLAAVKALVERLGVEEVKSIAELFG